MNFVHGTHLSRDQCLAAIFTSIQWLFEGKSSNIERRDPPTPSHQPHAQPSYFLSQDSILFTVVTWKTASSFLEHMLLLKWLSFFNFSLSKIKKFSTWESMLESNRKAILSPQGTRYHRELSAANTAKRVVEVGNSCLSLFPSCIWRPLFIV